VGGRRRAWMCTRVPGRVGAHRSSGQRAGRARLLSRARGLRAACLVGRGCWFRDAGVPKHAEFEPAGRVDSRDGAAPAHDRMRGVRAAYRMGWVGGFRDAGIPKLHDFEPVVGLAPRDGRAQTGDWIRRLRMRRWPEAFLCRFPVSSESRRGRDSRTVVLETCQRPPRAGVAEACLSIRARTARRHFVSPPPSVTPPAD
jgi:hypothetical protein